LLGGREEAPVTSSASGNVRNIGKVGADRESTYTEKRGDRPEGR